MEGIIRLMALLLIGIGLQQLHLISVFSVDGKPDPYIYGLCTVLKYRNDSEYESNVNAVLEHLVNAADKSDGFATYSHGQVKGLLQCRGDVSDNECQKCSTKASQMAYEDCPNAIGARIQMEFCFIRYENYNFESVLDTDVVFSVENVKSNSDIHGFNKTLENLLESLAGKAPSNVKRFAAKSSEVHSDSVTIYGLEMCLRSLAEHDCGVCLRTAIAAMNQYGYSSQVGLQMFMGSCTIRFEIYPFYNKD